MNIMMKSVVTLGALCSWRQLRLPTMGKMNTNGIIKVQCREQTRTTVPQSMVVQSDMDMTVTSA